MFIIGERINGMFGDVAQAIKKKDKKVIQDLAKKQLESGANALDVNVGPAADNPLEVMEWLVNTIGEVSDAALAIDTTKADVMEAGLKLCKGKSIINSVQGSQEKMDLFLPLAGKYKSAVICLTINEKGIPGDAASRTEIAVTLLTACQEKGIDVNDIFIDAVILPVSATQEHSKAVLETITQIKILSDPPPKTILGLSNVSQKASDRSLVNSTYMSMAVSAGLDAAILDPMDNTLMNTMITAELLLGKQIYCENYIEAYKKS